jgi:hypothetical protein
MTDKKVVLLEGFRRRQKSIFLPIIQNFNKNRIEFYPNKEVLR